MKNKTEVESKTLHFDKAVIRMRPKQSLRPTRSLVAVRSLKPKTAVATLMLMKNDDSIGMN